MSRSRNAPRRSALTAAVAGSLALLLVACAPEPGTLRTGAEPSRTELRSPERIDPPPAAAAEAPAAGTGADAGENSPAGTEAAPAQAADSEAVDARAVVAAPKGLLGERLRNTRARFAARFVYVPGSAKFNRLVNRELRAAIATTKRRYAPQVFAPGAGLGERGCVPGSSRWRAADVLKRSATAPPRGRGTAVTCEVISASGSVIQVAMRTVRGSSKRIARDTTTILYADVATGAAGVVDPAKLWRSEAPNRLWERAVTQLITAAGGSVTAPLSAPGPAQLRLAKLALRSAKTTVSGGALATIRPGITAPELLALGVAPTGTATKVSVDRATAISWSSRVGRLLREAVGKRFAGVHAPASSVTLNCALLPCVALTYDDGPGPYTSQLLSTLRTQRARATFFMIGSNIPGRRAVVRRAVADGHEIGSHTMHHPDLTRLSLRAARAEVLDAAALIRSVSGQPVTLFRPPYGAINDRIIRKVGLPAIVWNVDTNDWRRPGKAALVQRSVPVVQAGGIILFHDIHPDSVAVAGTVISGLRDRGFELVTVSQLFGGKVPLGRISGRY